MRRASRGAAGGALPSMTSRCLIKHGDGRGFYREAMRSVDREDRKRHSVSKTGSDLNVPSVYWLITWESRLPEPLIQAPYEKNKRV